MMYYTKILGLSFLSFFLVSQTTFSQERGTGEAENNVLSVSELKKEIEKYPDSLQLHEQFLRKSGFTRWGADEDTSFVNQYKKWIKKFPQSATLQYAIGHAYANRESPKAKEFLLKAIELDPEMDLPYNDLWIDAQRWGEFEKGREFLKRATEIKPDNPDYAFYYASSFSAIDPQKYKDLSLKVAERFPESDRGAQALYWLGTRDPDFSSKIQYYDLLREKYAPSKYRWSSSGMSSYYDVLLIPYPEKALALARDMETSVSNESEKKHWESQRKTAEKVLAVDQLLKNKKPADALSLLDSIQLPRWSDANSGLTVLRARALKADNRLKEGYHKLLSAYSSSPVKEIGTELKEFGRLLGKNSDKVNDDVWYVRDTAAKQATDFSLKKYTSDDRLSLADLKGKIVLLTYWFPGCGPCRGEFPHFQNVVNKFSDKDIVYVGINIVPEQNEYVLPFLKSSGYTFIPLEDFEGRKKGNLENGGAAPVNFVLDEKGRIIFRNFMINVNNEDVLYEMVSSLVDKKNRS